MSEQEKFLEGLEQKDVIEELFNKSLEETQEEPEPKQETEEEQEMKLRNRRERRLNEKLQKERESNIALNARLQAINESKNIRGDSDPEDYLTRIERIYGTDSPEAKEATRLLAEALRGVEERATKNALDRFREEREKEKQEEVEAVQQLDSLIESVEDAYNVDLSSGPDRKSFLKLLEKLSPKDEEGNIIEFADAESVYEIFKSTKEKSTDKAKALAGRSMIQGGNGNTSAKVEEDATLTFLKKNGIL